MAVHGGTIGTRTGLSVNGETFFRAKVTRNLPRSLLFKTIVKNTSIKARTSENDASLITTTYVAETLLPTRHGRFRLRGYRHTVNGGRSYSEPAAVIVGDVKGLQDVVVRVHDACFTSEVLGSLKCDCAEQLHMALSFIQANPPGIIIYLQQEGRGIGLANKIAAYSLQERGVDTVDANRLLGLPDDCREYSAVRNILKELGVRGVRLMTNNPRKLLLLAALGVAVTGRVPCQVAPGEHSQGYLEAKRSRMNHLIDFSEPLASSDFADIGAGSGSRDINGSGNGAGLGVGVGLGGGEKYRTLTRNVAGVGAGTEAGVRRSFVESTNQPTSQGESLGESDSRRRHDDGQGEEGRVLLAAA